MPSYESCGINASLPASSFSFNKGEPDEQAAYDASLTVDGLLSYRAQHQGHLPFLCSLDPFRNLVEKYTL